MRTLILLRHGEAASSGAGGDIERPLTAQGERDATAAGEALGNLGARPDLVLISPAKRTRQTWAAASAALGGPPVSVSKALLHTDAQTLLSAAQDAKSEGTVMLVGHNPAIAELTDRLARLSGASDAATAFSTMGFPPASAAVFAQTTDGWRFEAFLPPRSAT